MNETSSYGLWSLVIINSLFFIAFAFSFTRPRTNQDWRSLGAYSAFILALFTEMYGFRVNLIYLLSGWLSSKFPGIDFFAHDSGHLLEVMFGWSSNPHFGPFHLLSTLFIVGGFWLLAKAWPVLLEAQRTRRVADSIAYARIRHPPYVALVLVMFGFFAAMADLDQGDHVPGSVDRVRQARPPGRARRDRGVRGRLSLIPRAHAGVHSSPAVVRRIVWSRAPLAK